VIIGRHGAPRRPIRGHSQGPTQAHQTTRVGVPCCAGRGGAEGEGLGDRGPTAAAPRQLGCRG